MLSTSDSNVQFQQQTDDVTCVLVKVITIPLIRLLAIKPVILHLLLYSYTDVLLSLRSATENNLLCRLPLKNNTNFHSNIKIEENNKNIKLFLMLNQKFLSKFRKQLRSMLYHNHLFYFPLKYNSIVPNFVTSSFQYNRLHHKPLSK